MVSSHLLSVIYCKTKSQPIPDDSIVMRPL